MGTLRFVLRTDHPDKQGCSPIEGLYQISRERKYFRIDSKFKLRPENWYQGKDKQEAIYLDKKAAKKVLPDVEYDTLPTLGEVEGINSRLRSVRDTIRDKEELFRLSKKPYDTGMIIQAYRESLTPETKPEPRSSVLFDAIEKFIKDNEETMEKGSLIVYKTLKTHLRNFESKHNIKVTFESIDYNFFTLFQKYLLDLKKENGEPQLYNRTIAKKLSTIKSFLNYARLNGYAVNDGYKDFAIKDEAKKKVIALSNEEFEKLFYMDLSGNKRLDQVRDMFCFSCSTGMRYSDMAMLRRENIKSDHITITVKKTKDPLTIPLNPFSATILEKYKAQYKPLPIISNQKSNAYLKGYTDKKTGIYYPGLCEIAGINEQIEIVRFRGKKRHSAFYAKYLLVGVHTGRKTFCTLSLEKGMSAEQVMATSGHLDYKNFKSYIDITEKLKKEVMKAAWGEVKLPAMKVV